MAASPRDPRRSDSADVTTASDGVAPLVTPTQRSRLGMIAAAVGILAVILVAGDAPVVVRAPVVLVAMLFLPGYPVVARLRLDLPTLIAADIALSLALEAALALLTVELKVYHPDVIGLGLAFFGVGGTFVTLTSIRHDEAKHLS